MILDVSIYAWMVILVAACSSKPGDSLSAATTEQAQVAAHEPQVALRADASAADSASADEARRLAMDLHHAQAELAATRQLADERQERARQATAAAQEARAQIERLTRTLAALRRSAADKSREIAACNRAAAEMLSAKADLELQPAAPEHLLAEGQPQQVCDRPRFVFKRSDALN